MKSTSGELVRLVPHVARATHVATKLHKLVSLATMARDGAVAVRELAKHVAKARLGGN